LAPKIQFLQLLKASEELPLGGVLALEAIALQFLLEDNG